MPSSKNKPIAFFQFQQITPDPINNTLSCQLQESDQGLCIKIDNLHARASVSLFGGHMLSYICKNDNKERLWLSDNAIFDQKTPIRGGIPICWPWFSAHETEPTYPSHGYARTQMWQLVSIEEQTLKQNVSLTRIVLQPSQPEQYGYTRLKVKLVIEIGEQLEISLETTNQSNKNIHLSQALHTYLRINNIENTYIEGVTSPYDDKPSKKRLVPAPIDYNFVGETDRIHYFEHQNYSLTQAIEVFEQAEHNPQLLHRITHGGHDSTVVWNPGIEKSLAMQDMPKNGHKQMLCIEAGNTQNTQKPLTLQPQQSHTLRQIIK